MLMLGKIWVCEACGDVWEQPSNVLPARNADGGVICDECAEIEPEDRATIESGARARVDDEQGMG